MKKKMKLVGMETPATNNKITVSPQPAAEEPKPVAEEPKAEPVVEEVVVAEEVATEDTEEVSPKRSRKKQADSEEN